MSLGSMVAGSDNRPTKQMMDMFMDLTARIEVQIARLKPIITDGLAKFNKAALEQGSVTVQMIE
jgi:hypothetical protein